MLKLFIRPPGSSRAIRLFTAYNSSRHAESILGYRFMNESESRSGVQFGLVPAVGREPGRQVATSGRGSIELFAALSFGVNAGVV